MHPLRTTTALLLLTLTACGASDAGTTSAGETGGATDTSGGATDTTAGPTTTAAATTSGSTGHASHDTHETHAEATGAETTAETTSGSTHATHTTADPDTTAGTTGGASPVEDYCICMLENCHDQYHATWGEDHRGSEAMCEAAAGAVPSVGVPAMSGDSIECRLYFCALGHDDPAACDSAMGAAPCE